MSGTPRVAMDDHGRLVGWIDRPPVIRSSDELWRLAEYRWGCEVSQSDSFLADWPDGKREIILSQDLPSYGFAPVVVTFNPVRLSA